MSVTEFIHQDKNERRFSFEVLPPLKGTGTDKLFADIDKLREFDPAYINITTHHSEFVYKELESAVALVRWPLQPPSNSGTTSLCNPT